MTVSRPYINFRTKQYVYSLDTTKPYVGFENLDESPEGWQYNIKRWCSIFDLRLPRLPRLVDGSTQGIKESEYFLSGVGSVDIGDIYLDKLEEVFGDNNRLWVPNLRHGHYFRFKTPFFLYSDNSRIQYVSPADNKDGKNFVELDKEPDMNSPILAATFKRHPSTNTPYYDTKINQVAAFSGIYVNGEEQETVSLLGKINWVNVNTSKKEFIIDNTIEGKTFLRFNRDFVQTHGIVPSTYQDLAACEVVGRSNGKNFQAYYLEHFPVLADDTFHLYLVTGLTFEELVRVDSWHDLINSEDYVYTNRFYLDKDLGIIYFGTAAQGGSPELGTFLVASYKSTIRIEYEQEGTSTDLLAMTADTNPLSQSLNQGFVCITHDQLEAATITLSIDKQKIPFTVNPVEYGPMYVGTDYALLRATVKSAEGNPVPKIEVKFTMNPSNVGGLNGASTAVGVTNGKGEAFVNYQPPVSADNMGFYSTTVRAATHPDYSTGYKEIILNTNMSGLEDREEDLYLYQVLKDDILLGYNTLDNYLATLDQPAWVVDTDTYNRWKEEMILEYNIKDWAGIQSDGSLIGRKVVVYKLTPTVENYKVDAIHPVTGDTGAIVPVRPEYIYIEDNTTVLVYPEEAIPDPDPEDSGNNIGGYWAVASKLVEFQASCFSEYYNREIYSNKITVRLSLPQYMLGEYINDLLQKVPFGWKLPSDTDNIAAGMDGATFITVNPHAKPYPENDVLWGPYNILNLVNGTTSDDWASAPFNSIGFQFNIE